MSRRKILISTAIALVLVAIAMFLSGRIQYVDSKPSNAIAENYFSKLTQGQVDSALDNYSDKFRAEHTKFWSDILSGLQQRYGVVTAFNLIGSSIVPVDGTGCTLLRYQVGRGSLLSGEDLILCPDKQSVPEIIGHQITRLDTHQTISAGAIVIAKEFGIRVP